MNDNAFLRVCETHMFKYAEIMFRKLVNMRRYILQFAFALIFSMKLTFVFAQSVESILFKGSELIYPLPKGFCNITDEIQGIMLKDFIDKQKNPMLPIAQLIIAPCEQSTSNPGYPWGWVGIMKDGNGITQKTLNKMMANLLANETMIEKLEKHIQKKGAEVLNDDYGIDVKLENDKQKIIWADKDSILLIGNISAQLDGNVINEVYVTSTTVLGDLYAYTYLYNLEDSIPSLKQLSKLLITHAPRLKALNEF